MVKRIYRETLSIFWHGMKPIIAQNQSAGTSWKNTSKVQHNFFRGLSKAITLPTPLQWTVCCLCIICIFYRAPERFFRGRIRLDTTRQLQSLEHDQQLTYLNHSDIARHCELVEPSISASITESNVVLIPSS